MKSISLIVIIFVLSICSAAFSDDISFDELENFVASQSGEIVSQSFEIDLNSDGKKDKLMGATSGNAGCNFFIFIKTGENSYAYKGNVFIHSMGFEILKTSHNGINDLLAYSRSNVAEGTLVRYEHDGKTYRVKAQLYTKSGKEAFELIRPSYTK